ncbi:hypothetical protein OPAG_06592 [Rhodococcus opacus PD630]|uniref:LysR family transcriptional regulator n=1 Tax=Rhodococcus opacus TaxID=37919 RepID=UPI00029CB425|nr:LysR family transcriptional regulator [Rhodococcus opacus]AHK35709.1 putative HTH-type transcriptional regulator yfeR [Rhodococcus opacus PD630]EHI43316.1 hypothetical protein OPAG_06592 [Rhodococcus opacus PD630]UDH01491.1 LysR family transcriptional regulator [Rhodococcus opacus PD630]
MDLRRVEMFLGVVDAGTFAGAAARLGFVQSTISAGITALERDLGVQLFDRTSRTASLTTAGRALVPEARALTARAALARRVVQDADRTLSGQLTVGVINSIRPIPLPRALARLNAAHPGVGIRVLSDAIGSAGLVERLRRSELDAIIASGDLTDEQARDLLVTPLCTGALVCAVGVGDALHPQALRLAEIADHRWIESPLGQANRSITDAAFGRAGLARQVVAEVADPADVPEYVAAGLGIAIVPDFLVAARDDLRVLPVLDAELRWSIAAIRLAHRQSAVLDEFWRELLATVRERDAAR